MQPSTILWNAREHRPRLVWRVVGFLTLVLLALVVGGIALAVLAPGRFVDRQGELLVSGLVSATAVVAAAGVAAVALDRRRTRDYGLDLDRDWAVDFGAGLGVGAGLATLVFVVEVALGWVSITGFGRVEGSFSFPVAFLAVVVAFLLLGFVEELAFRGYVLTNVAEQFRFAGAWPAVLVAVLTSSLVFGGLHLTNPGASLLSVVGVALAGVMLGLAYVLTGDLGLPVGIHVAWNLFQGAVFGFPVSGFDPAVSVVAVSQQGPVRMTGGAFGPEAGVVGIAATLVGVAVVVAYARRRYAPLDFSTVLVPEFRWWEWASPVDVPGHDVSGDTLVFDAGADGGLPPVATEDTKPGRPYGTGSGEISFDADDPDEGS